MNIREHDLAAKFVDASYFLFRIKDFEEKYQLDWGNFLSDFKNGKLVDATGERYTDYSEWAFLCTTFMSELIECEGKSPPPEHEPVVFAKPEPSSGFSFDPTCQPIY